MFNRFFGAASTPSETPPPTPVEQRPPEEQQQQQGGWFGWGSGTAAPAAPVPCILPELASPETPDEYRELIKSKLDLLKQLTTAQDWNDIGFKPAPGHESVKVWDKVVPNSNAHLVRTVADMPCSPQALFNNLTCANVPELNRWDPDLDSVRIVDTFEENHKLEVIIQRYRAPFPVSNRAFLCARGVEIEEDGTIWLVAVGINRKDFPEEPGFVRGALIFAGWKISPVEGNPNACFQDRIVQLDPKGWIPITVVNLFKNKAGESLVQQRRVFLGELGPVPS
jgi:hypothetical protein